MKPNNDDRDAIENAWRLMGEIGGGFAKKLSAAWFHADSGNRQILNAAFRDLLNRYLEKQKVAP